MALVEAMISRVQVLCGRHTAATADIILSLINTRHSDLLESYDWSRKKTEIVVATLPDKSTGTLAVSNGNSAVVGTGTSFTASDAGRYVTIGSDTSFYVMKTVSLATSFALGDLNNNTIGYAGTTGSGLAYNCFSRWYSLGAGIEQIISVNYQVKLGEVSQEYLDTIDPHRSSTGDPVCFARGPRNMSGSNDIARIEFWPRPSSSIAVNISVQRGHVDLVPTQAPLVPSGPLEWFAAEDMCYNLFAKTKDEKWIKLAATFATKGATSLEFELGQDAKKFGVQQQVRDAYSGAGLESTDFAITHDV